MMVPDASKLAISGPSNKLCKAGRAKAAGTKWKPHAASPKVCGVSSSLVDCHGRNTSPSVAAPFYPHQSSLCKAPLLPRGLPSWSRSCLHEVPFCPACNPLSHECNKRHSNAARHSLKHLLTRLPKRMFMHVSWQQHIPLPEASPC